MHDAPGGDGDLIPAGLALEQLPGRFPVRFSPSAARADKPLGPARINQVLEARLVRIKAALEDVISALASRPARNRLGTQRARQSTLRQEARGWYTWASISTNGCRRSRSSPPTAN